ncbi:MAG: DNA-3-methyladenine glycosylase 2 family protein [Actinomycetota bacterium]|nr:DNA-3-methyladenine glycosylase 2 family protein [Actinomycetota bacterium]
MKERRLEPQLPFDLHLTLGRLAHGTGDPTVRVEPDGIWRATRTPDGPATQHVTSENGTIVVQACGPGASWLLEAAPDLLGLHDDPVDFRPQHRIVHELHRRFRGLRIGRTNAVVEALIPAILEQKVVGKGARSSYRGLVRALGEPAPGPAGLLLQPDPQRLAETPYYELHPLGIERRRAEVLRDIGRRAARLEHLTSPERLRAIQGVGAWTAAEVAAVAFGDPDAVSVGDYHLPHLVSWALAGEPRGTDDRMLELLSPYAGQRGRVIRLLESSGLTAPRFGPRLPVRSIARI